MITQSGIEYPSTLQPAVGPARLPPPVLVDSTPAFRDMIAALSSQPLLALDTESDSLYRYFFKVGLVQISTPATDYLVDPLRLPDLTPLGDILANPCCGEGLSCRGKRYPDAEAGFQLPLRQRV